MTKNEMNNMNELIGKIRLWGEQRCITGPEGRATADTQFEKLIEEVDEIRAGLQSGIQEAVVDGIGDTAVVLILLAELIGVPFEECLESAYNVIKNRTGRMIDGQFVKDSNQ